MGSNDSGAEATSKWLHPHLRTICPGCASTNLKCHFLMVTAPFSTKFLFHNQPLGCYLKACKPLFPISLLMQHAGRSVHTL